MTTSAITEETIQDICPDFCEYGTHGNIGTPEQPIYHHGMLDAVVHGFRLRITVSTDHDGREHPSGLVTVHLDDRELSLKEASDLAHALQRVVFDGELVDEWTSFFYAEGDVGKSARRGLEVRRENHERHVAARGDQHPLQADSQVES